jgi:hypothetical protein
VSDDNVRDDNVSDEDGDIDGSDWLASQFDPTAEVPKQTPPAAPAPTPASPPAAAAPPAQPNPNPAQGFNWGLRPGGAAEPAQPATPTRQPPAPQTAPPAHSTATPAQSTPATPQPAAPPAPRAMPRESLPPTEPFVPVRPGSLVPPLVPPPAAREVDPGPPTEAMPQPLSWDSLDGVDQPTAAFTVPPWEPATASAAPPVVQQPPVQQPVAPQQQPPQPTVPQQPVIPLQPTVAFPKAETDEPRDPTSALDSLFGDNQFQEYEDLGVLQTITPPAASSPATSFGGTPFAAAGAYAPPVAAERAPITKTQRTLMIVAGALIALIALVALFFLGQRLGQQSAQPVGAPTGNATTPAKAPSNGLAAPGVQSFSALQGGECLQPFTSAWSATYTVVDCGSSHVGQLVFKGTLPDASGTPYPTGSQFKTEITPLCTSTSAIDYSVAKSVSDLQISFSYPSSAKDWDGGNRTYYCFVNRASGDPLPDNLAVTK